LIKCAGCGHNLTYTGTTNRDGRRTASYMCRGRYATGICPAPAAARAEIVDAFVREVVVLALVEGILDRSLDQVLRYDQAQQAVANSQRDLDALANPDLLRTLGPERLAQMAEPLKAAHEAAKQQPGSGTTSQTRRSSSVSPRRPALSSSATRRPALERRAQQSAERRAPPRAKDVDPARGCRRMLEVRQVLAPASSADDDAVARPLREPDRSCSYSFAAYVPRASVAEIRR